MSGGGSKKKKSSSNNSANEAVPAYLGGGVNSTFPQAMPGQIEAIAAQLSAGYGAPVAQNMAFLDNLYSPMTVPMQSAPVGNPGPNPKPTPKPNPIMPTIRREYSRGDR